MAKRTESTPSEGQTVPPQSGDQVEGKNKRKRSASKFTLCRELAKEDGEEGSKFQVVSAGNTVNQLRKDAAGMDDGRYAIMCIRAVIEVKTATTKTVTKVK